MPQATDTGRKGRLRQLGEKVAASRAGSWFFLSVAPRIDKRLLPLTRGRFSVSGPMPVGLLTTTGARSGLERTTPLLYLADGDRIVLVASKTGRPENPAWFHNLRANPDVRFLSRKGNGPYRARVAEGEERERLWAAMTDLYSGYDTYSGRTTRRIPIVVLEPPA